MDESENWESWESEIEKGFKGWGESVLRGL